MFQRFLQNIASSFGIQKSPDPQDASNLQILQANSATELNQTNSEQTSSVPKDRLSLIRKKAEEKKVDDYNLTPQAQKKDKFFKSKTFRSPTSGDLKNKQKLQQEKILYKLNSGTFNLKYVKESKELQSKQSQQQIVKEQKKKFQNCTQIRVTSNTSLRKKELIDSEIDKSIDKLKFKKEDEFNNFVQDEKSNENFFLKSYQIENKSLRTRQNEESKQKNQLQNQRVGELKLEKSIQNQEKKSMKREVSFSLDHQNTFSAFSTTHLTPIKQQQQSQQEQKTTCFSSKFSQFQNNKQNPMPLYLESKRHSQPQNQTIFQRNRLQKSQNTRSAKFLILNDHDKLQQKQGDISNIYDELDDGDQEKYVPSCQSAFAYAPKYFKPQLGSLNSTLNGTCIVGAAFNITSASDFPQKTRVSIKQIQQHSEQQQLQEQKEIILWKPVLDVNLDQIINNTSQAIIIQKNEEQVKRQTKK